MEKVSGEVVGTPAAVNLTIPSVVKSAAVVDPKKQSALKKLWKGFFAEDLKTVRGNITENVIKPGIKSVIANMITGAVNMWLFGKNGTPSVGNGLFRPLWYGNNTINYASPYKISPNGVTAPTNVIQPNQSKMTVTNDANIGRYTSTDVYNPEFLRYASWQDAENVYTEMLSRVAQYGVATVKNLMDASGVTGYEVVLQNWGWYDIPNHRVIPVGDGTWILKLPQPCALSK